MEARDEHARQDSYFQAVGVKGSGYFDVYAGVDRIGCVVYMKRGWTPLGVFLLGKDMTGVYFDNSDGAIGALIDRWYLLSDRRQVIATMRAANAVLRDWSESDRNAWFARVFVDEPVSGKLRATLLK